VERRHRADHTRQQATEQALKSPQDMAREILTILPEVVAVLPDDEVNDAFNALPRFAQALRRGEPIMHAG
jgi:hypothetical protein